MPVLAASNAVALPMLPEFLTYSQVEQEAVEVRWRVLCGHELGIQDVDWPCEAAEALVAVAAGALAFQVLGVESGMVVAYSLLDAVPESDTLAFDDPARAVDKTAVDWRTVVAVAVAGSTQAMGEEPEACRDSLEVASLRWAMDLRAYEAVAAGNAADVPVGVGAFVVEACLANQCAPSAAMAGTACLLEEARLASATEMHETWPAAPAD